MIIEPIRGIETPSMKIFIVLNSIGGMACHLQPLLSDTYKV